MRCLIYGAELLQRNGSVQAGDVLEMNLEHVPRERDILQIEDGGLHEVTGVLWQVSVQGFAWNRLYRRMGRLREVHLTVRKVSS